MKAMRYSILAMAVLLMASCQEEKSPWDASGVFETTDVIVSAKSIGEIKDFNLEEGMTVTAGQRLGYIDTLQLHLKKGQLNASQNATVSRKLSEDTQVAAIKQQIANLKSERQRFEELVKENAGTQKTVDDIDYQIKVLEQQLAAATEQVSTANQSIGGQSASMNAQRAQLNDQIVNSIITSPIDGTILTKYAQAGEYAAPGRALFKVGDVKHMKLRAYVTADQLTQLKLGQQVKVYADQGTADRKEYAGEIIWISDKAEFTPKTIQTRDERANLVYAIKIAVENDGLIKRGMYGDVKF
ncbi:MAG: HlyD family efflux transporter periplasmic adaptor subunit [Muribaculaceae bacterium]|nr:HlyD family efflux transporter periplasmic adaptor subunit [Muribaculaceae bacterium]